MSFGLLKWLGRKLVQIIPTIIGASLLAFLLVRLIPGDPVLNLLGERGGDPAVVAALRAKLGLDKSLVEQYFIFLKNSLVGDFGTSIISKNSVLSEFLARFPATVELSLVALLWSTLLGIPLGVWAAVKRGTWWDFSVIGASLVGYSMPIFWWGLILILVFSVKLGWFPVSGRIDVVYDIPHWSGFYLIDLFKGVPSEDLWPAFKSVIRHLILPSIVLGTIPLAVLARMTRSSMLENLHEDFVRTAKAKGVSPYLVIMKHALRNALIPVVTVFGVLLGSLLTGAVLTETIFSWPGIGRWLVASIQARDYPVIQAGVLLLSLIIVVINILIDVVYYWVQPRLRGGL